MSRRKRANLVVLGIVVFAMATYFMLLLQQPVIGRHPIPPETCITEVTFPTGTNKVVERPCATLDQTN